ncbi:MAG: aspartate 1-decarboxylase [Candidatus Omnitrophota bacterium]|nr:aspartate 1-decarboxylase [Candidatus Omnitrophota bacterium]
MMRIMLKSKISFPTITEAQLYYKGSITIDQKIMIAADLFEGERVDILNRNTGARLQTYVIKGEPGSGVICLNGPAARMGCKGDKLVIISYGFFSEEEVQNFKPKCVEVDDENRVTNI